MNQQAKPTISFDDFLKLDFRVAKVTAVRDHPNADKLIILDIDLGAEQRQIIAGLKPYCDPQSLVGKNIAVILNLPPRKMRGLESNGMLLAATWGEGEQQQVVILTTDGDVPAGATVM
jgi:methionine--tRNA ligase beta chain